MIGQTMLRCTLLSVILALGARGEGTMDLSGLVPTQLGDWSSDGDDGTYDRETIFKYMDGAGEIYLSFSFERLLVRKFYDGSEGEATVELYDMGDSEDAYGVFTRSRRGQDVGIGQGSEYQSGYLLFWRERYFVILFADQETNAKREFLFELGTQIAERIGKDGDRPWLVEVLPEVGLDRLSIRFFHKYTDLNQHYFLSDDNILDLGQKTDCVIATYSNWEVPIYLLVVQYPDERSATLALQRYLEEHRSPSSETGLIHLDDGLWATGESKGRHLIAVLDAPTVEEARRLLREASERIEKEKG